jgi:DNA recombination protein RmuC
MWIVIGIAGVALAWIGLSLWLQRRLDGMKGEMVESFKAHSYEVMERSSKSFLGLAEAHLSKYQEGAKADLEGRQKAIEATLEPLKTVMKQLDVQQREMEKRREGAYSSMQKQIEQMMASDRELRHETSQLVASLRSPQIRGSWGQVHLRRVVELAGLLNQCDFSEQVSMQNEGKTLRPDLVVRLPGDRQIVVDAKTPLNSFIDAADLLDEGEKKRKLLDHAASIRKHIKDLSSKEYWKAFDLSPEYVILFLPAESFFSAALQVDPTLIEVGADQNVIVATPTTLIAILRAVAFGWKQESLSKSAKEISRLGGELYDRLGIVCEHWGKVGRQLGSAVESYNQSVASLETRVLVSAKKLKEFGGITKELPEPEQIEKLTRLL